jgi:hypothetical protein
MLAEGLRLAGLQPCGLGSFGSSGTNRVPTGYQPGTNLVRLGHLGQHKQHDPNDLKRRRWG